MSWHLPDCLASHQDHNINMTSLFSISLIAPVYRHHKHRPRLQFNIQFGDWGAEDHRALTASTELPIPRKAWRLYNQCLEFNKVVTEKRSVVFIGRIKPGLLYLLGDMLPISWKIWPLVLGWYFSLFFPKHYKYCRKSEVITKS